MFRVAAKLTPIPNEYDIYVADIKVSKVLSKETREEIEARYQLPEIWLRYYYNDENFVDDTDIEITYTLSNLINSLEK